MNQELVQYATLITLVFGYIGGIVLWLWKGAGFIRRANESFDKLDKLDSRLDRVEAYLHEVGGFMGKKNKRYPRLREFNLVQAHSPITLTPQGHALVQDSTFFEFVQAHEAIWQDIVDASKARPDAESYIEKHVILKIAEMFDNDDIRLADVSDYIYQNGLRETKQIYNEVLRAFGVCARDHTLHLGGFTLPVAPEREDDGIT